MAQKTKLTYENIYKLIAEKDCILITTEYINMKQKLEIQCKCGKIYTTNLDTFKFKSKNQCNECSKLKLAKLNTSSNEKVKYYIESKGCFLMSEYESAIKKLKIKCECGVIFEKSFNKFKNGQIKCRECTGRTNWNFESVKKFIELDSKSDNILISNTYINRNQILDLRCKCLKEFNTNFHTFLYENKRMCDDCSMNRFKLKRRKGIKTIKKMVLISSDSELISSDYIDYREILEFKCKCKNIFNTSLSSFNNGKKSCDTCSPKSKLEYIAEKFFIKENTNYKSQYVFEDLLSPKNRKLKFDFAILDDKDNLSFLLELDGEQHFKPSNLFGGQLKFEKQLIHDELKNKYCENKSIKLYRVSYKELNNLEKVLSKILCEHDNPVLSS